MTVATGGWIMPGLVDAHCHVGLECTARCPTSVAEQHALADRAAGALLLRDAGSPPTPAGWTTATTCRG